MYTIFNNLLKKIKINTIGMNNVISIKENIMRLIILYLITCILIIKFFHLQNP